MQVLEANERKVGLVRFIPTDNEGEEDLDNKGVNRVVSKKVIKQKKQTVYKPEKCDEEIEESLEDGCSHQTILLQEQFQSDGSISHAIDEKVDNHDWSIW